MGPDGYYYVMKRSLRKLAVWMMTGATLAALSVSCKEEESDPNNVLKGGSINGQVSPADAVTTVTATGGSNTSVSANPGVGGAFTIGNLAAGTYTVSFTPANGYVAPPSRTVTVSTGSVTDLGTITVGGGGPTNGGTLRFVVTGQTIAASSLTAFLAGEVLSIQAATPPRSITLTLAPVTGPGIIDLVGGQSSATYSFNSTTQMVWSTTQPGGGGTVQITSFDPVTRRASGTFNFVAQPLSGGASGEVLITNGLFTDLTF